MVQSRPQQSRAHFRTGRILGTGLPRAGELRRVSRDSSSTTQVEVGSRKRHCRCGLRSGWISTQRHAARAKPTRQHACDVQGTRANLRCQARKAGARRGPPFSKLLMIPEPQLPQNIRRGSDNPSSGHDQPMLPHRLTQHIKLSTRNANDPMQLFEWAAKRRCVHRPHSKENAPGRRDHR